MPSSSSSASPPTSPVHPFYLHPHHLVDYCAHGSPRAHPHSDGTDGPPNHLGNRCLAGLRGVLLPVRPEWRRRCLFDRVVRTVLRSTRSLCAWPLPWRPLELRGLTKMQKGGVNCVYARARACAYMPLSTLHAVISTRCNPSLRILIDTTIPPIRMCKLNS